MPIAKPLLWVGLTLVLGFVLGMVVQSARVSAEAETRVFELRTHTAPEGKLNDLQTRFREHTMQLFTKHRHHQHRLLGAAGRAAGAEHAHLHHRLPQS